MDCEERYNASHAAALAAGHLDMLLDLQYQPFCGGCTLTAVLGAPLAWVSGSFFAWKLVPVAAAAAMCWVGTRALLGRVGPAAGVAFALLMLLPPFTWLRMSLIAWGNHYEVGLPALAALALLAAPAGRRRDALLGLVLGLGLWISFSATFAVLATALVLAARREWGALGRAGLGLAAGASPWLLQWLVTGETAFVTIYRSGEAIPSLAGAPAKLAALLHPDTLAALYGLPRRSLGLPLGLGWAASLAAALALGCWRGPRLARLAAVFLGCWLVIYLLSGFSIDAAIGGPRLAETTALRYTAPTFPLAMALLAAAAGAAWSARRWLGTALLLAPLAAGLAARAASLSAPFPDGAALRFVAASDEYFREQAGHRFSARQHARCGADNTAVHDYALGRAEAQRSLEDLSALTPGSPQRAAGVGSALVDHLDPDFTGAADRMAEVMEALEVLPQPGRQAAMREAAWRRIYAAGPGLVSRDTRHDAAALEASIEALPTGGGARAAQAWAAGRRRAREAALWALPDAVPFPRPPARAARAFAEGFGYGLGEEWGPRLSIPRPAELPPRLEEPLREGYAAGAARGWLEREPRPPVLMGGPTGLGGPRWWRPGPVVYCSCRTTCE